MTFRVWYKGSMDHGWQETTNAFLDDENDRCNTRGGLPQGCSRKDGRLEETFEVEG